MTSDELRAAAVEMFGDRGYTTDLALRLGVERSSVHRYMSGQLPVPGPVAAAVLCWLTRYRETGVLPQRV